MDITESTTNSAPFPAWSNAAQAKAYQFISGELELGSQDVRADYPDRVNLASSFWMKLASQGDMWHNAFMKQNPGLDCAMDTCWAPVASQLLVELSALAELNVLQEMEYELIDQYITFLGWYIESAGNLVELDTEDEVTTPDGHSWFHIALKVFDAGVQLVGLAVPEEEALNNFLTVVAGTANLCVSHYSGGTETTDNVDWYMDNSATEQRLAALQVGIPRTYAGMKAACGNQVTTIAGDWGKLQDFETRMVRTRNNIPSRSTANAAVEPVPSPTFMPLVT